jgi:hypothetical protein
MVTGYLESKEGQKAFAEIGQPYAKSLQDELYDEWLKDTSAERLKEYSKHSEKEVTQIRRVKTGDGKEYLVYSYVEHRLDKALNVTHRWRPQAGKYPIPQASYYIQRLDFGKEERKFREIRNIETGYSIPYSPKKVDEIQSIGIPIDGKQAYLMQTENGIRIAVKSYKDFRDGDFDELAHFGYIPSELERKLWLERGGGAEADRQKREEYKRRIDERDVPQKVPTVQEVKDMIDQAEQQRNVRKEEAQALKKTQVEGKNETQAVKQVTKGRPSTKKK